MDHVTVNIAAQRRRVLEILAMAGRPDRGNLDLASLDRTAHTVPDDPRAMAQFIDHTLLRPQAGTADIDNLCDEAAQHGFFAVCIPPRFVQRASRRLHGRARVVTVVGFPHGASTSRVKAYEASCAIDDGADEVDMVLAIGALKEGDLVAVYDDVAGVIGAANGRGVKVILETAMLDDVEKVVACVIAEAAGASFVKTSTGFGGHGATVDDVRLMRSALRGGVQVKASGGIRSAHDARKMLGAGATRLGCSAGVAIVTGEDGTSGY